MTAIVTRGNAADLHLPVPHHRRDTVNGCRWSIGTLVLYAGRCPVCRCTRIHRDQGWAEVSILGWTLGAAQDAQRSNRWGPLLPAFRFSRSHSRWQAGRSEKSAQILLAEFAVLADDLQKPDPWMNGDDYGEGYTDGKSAAARRICAVLAGEGPK